METLSNLAFGLGVALSWQNILYCFIGCFLGTLVGVLPGIGPVASCRSPSGSTRRRR
jgi:TctA family transporter